MLSDWPPSYPVPTLPSKPYHLSLPCQVCIVAVTDVRDELELASGNGRQGSIEIAEWFDKQNEAGWQDVLQTKRGCDVISLAHFLPHQVTITSCILPTLTITSL